jgi:glyoxalase family protein
VQLHGIHHITAITADAPGNVDFYCRVLGLRMVKKTVNFDAPEVYHLYYADEEGTPGSVLTFFEFPGAAKGRPGPGMVHRIVWRVRDEQSLDFWEERLGSMEIEVNRTGAALHFSDPEGLGLEIVAGSEADDPLKAEAPDIPVEHALTGFQGVRAYSDPPDETRLFLSETLGFEEVEGVHVTSGRRRSAYALDPAPPEMGVQGAGTVHHIAWATEPNEQQEWRLKVAGAGAHVTPIIDRTYFLSIYFREPGGVLFEIATLGPGFTVDEPLESLGESLTLPERYESLRSRLEASLTPVTNPRTGAGREE